MNRLFLFSLILMFISGSLKEYIGISDEMIELSVILIWGGIALPRLDLTNFYNDGVVKVGGLYLIWILVSCLINQRPLADWFLYGRNMVALLLLYLSLNTLKWNEAQCNSVIRLLIWVTALQVLTSLFHLLFYGPAEYRVGTIFFGGGGMANNFMIAICGYAVAWVFWSSQKLKNLWGIFGLVLIGLASGKRSTVLIYPFFLIVSLFYCTLLTRNIRSLLRLAAISLMIIGIAVTLLQYMDHLGGYDKKEYTTLAERIEGAFEYALEYENRGYEGYFYTTFGRVANTSLMCDYLLSDQFKPFWSGEGPMTCSKRYAWTAREKYFFGYGISGWSDEILSIGVPGMLLGVLFYVVLLFKMIKVTVFEKLTRTGKMLYVGNLVFFTAFLFVHFFYNSLFINSFQLQIFYVIACSLLINPDYRKNFQLSLQQQMEGGSHGQMPETVRRHE